MGISSGTSVTGAYELTFGAQETSDSTAYTAFAASVTQAWTDARVDTNDMTTPAIEIGGLDPFTPGTHRAAGAINIAAGQTVTLDGQGIADSVFLFQGSTMSVGEDVKILLINQAKAENVVWAITGSFAGGAGGAGIEFAGSIMADTVTFDARLHLEGSILAQTAVVLGADNEVYGCVVGLTAITLGINNYIVDVQDEDESANNFPVLTNADDQFLIACLPHSDTNSSACDPSPTSIEAMQDVLNSCTEAGIAEATSRRRRTTGIDIPLLELGDIVISPSRTLTAAGNVRGAAARGKERRLSYNCDAPGYKSCIDVIVCCRIGAYPFCGSPMDDDCDRRRDLEGSNTISTAEFELYLPFIRDECTSRYKVLAQGYLAANNVDAAACIATADSQVEDLSCSAILVTGGA